MKALFCSGLQGLFSMGSPFCHPLSTNTPYLFPSHVQECSKSWLSQGCKMSVAWRCILASCWASFCQYKWNWLKNSNDTFGAENPFGNGHFLGKCWHLLSCVWWRNVLRVLSREIWKMKTKNLGKNKSCVETIIHQLFSLVDRWRNPYGNSFQGDFLLLQ